MNTQNSNSQDPAPAVIGKKPSNTLAKLVGVLMLVAVAGGGYYYYQMQDKEKMREELLETSELIGNNENQTQEKQEEGFYDNALDDASTKIGQEKSASQSQQSSQTKSAASQDGDVLNAGEEEIDQYLGFKIVTEADPEAQAQKDEADRQKALASFESEILAEDGSAQMTPSDANQADGNSENSITAQSYDKVISARFVDGFAQYLVENYTTLSKSSPLNVNTFYGSHLKDLPQSAGISQSREFIMNYLYKAETLSRLYTDYEDQFLAAYKKYALSPLNNGSKYTEAQVKRMNAFYANYAGSLAQALLAISSMANFDEQLAHVYTAEQELKAVKDAFAKTQVEFDEARYAKNSTKKLSQDLKDYAAQIQKASTALKSKEQDLVSKIMQGNNVSLSTQDLVYVSKWLSRRKAQIANTAAWQATNRELAGIFSNISVKLKQ